MVGAEAPTLVLLSKTDSLTGDVAKAVLLHVSSGIETASGYESTLERTIPALTVPVQTLSHGVESSPRIFLWRGLACPNVFERVQLIFPTGVGSQRTTLEGLALFDDGVLRLGISRGDDVVELLVVDRHVDEFLHLSLKSVKVSVSDTKSLTSLRHTTVGGLSVTNAETLFRRLATLANGKRQQDAGGSTRP